MDGILMITYYNQSGNRVATTEAIVPRRDPADAPMLMTALSACIGLLPAAVSSGIGSQVQRPLATVVRRRHGW